MIYNNILETIGNTPIVRLNHIGPDHVDLYVKVESFNPLASVKDRLAFAIINDAEQKGTLQPGQTVIEATSGNTGIAIQVSHSRWFVRSRVISSLQRWQTRSRSSAAWSCVDWARRSY
jgi:threonine synthase